MRTLTQINREYETILQGEASEPAKSQQLAALMSEMEREHHVPAIRNAAWERQNPATIALYRKISMSRSL